MTSATPAQAPPQQMPFVPEDLRTRILRFLQFKNFSELESIDSEVHGGLVTLSGQVSTEWMKYLCVEYTRHVTGVLGVRDELTTRGSD